MKITKIQEQKKQSERYSIFVDDEFVVGVSQDILIQFGLHKGQEISKEELDRISQSEAKYKVYNKAINYLSYGSRSLKEMQDYLIKQKFSIDDPNQAIKQTIAKLIDQGYLNNYEYGKSYVRTAASINLKGPKLLRQELLKKGLSEDEIEVSLAEYSMSQQEENLRELCKKFIKTQKKYPPKMLKNKLNQYLINKGYNLDQINDYINPLDLASPEEDQLELLEKEASKQYRKYQRKYSGDKLKFSLSANLFNKGYDHSLINQWLENHADLFIESDHYE